MSPKKKRELLAAGVPPIPVSQLGQVVLLQPDNRNNKYEAFVARLQPSFFRQRFMETGSLFKKTKGTPNRLWMGMTPSSGSTLSISISFENGIPMANSDLKC